MPPQELDISGGRVGKKTSAVGLFVQSWPRPHQKYTPKPFDENSEKMNETQDISFNYSLPTRVIFGQGEISLLPSLVDEQVGSEAKILLVTGTQSLKANGLLRKITGMLGTERISLYDRVPPGPSPLVVEEATQLCRENACSIVVGIGGGSAMDVAKATAILSQHEGLPWPYINQEKEISQPGLPYIAVPTTSGSSSEVTPFSVMWDLREKRKYGLSNPYMFPTIALVDPDFTLSMRPTLTSISGMDPFTSAFEAYWSRHSQPVSDALALRAIRLIAENLEVSWSRRSPTSRAACSLATTLSGMAYSNTRGTTICHAISYSLTADFGVAHGLAVGILLAPFLRLNAPHLGDKLEPLLDALGVSDVEEACQKITAMMENCRLPTRLNRLRIKEGDLDNIVAAGLAQPQASNNPYDISPEEAREALLSIM